MHGELIVTDFLLRIPSPYLLYIYIYMRWYYIYINFKFTNKIFSNIFFLFSTPGYAWIFVSSKCSANLKKILCWGLIFSLQEPFFGRRQELKRWNPKPKTGDLQSYFEPFLTNFSLVNNQLFELNYAIKNLLLRGSFREFFFM